MKAIILILIFGISLLSYNPGGAIAYASQYCRNYNPSFNSYAGHDCANFVSQCMTAGGQSFDGCGGRNGYGMIPGVSNLKNCLTSKGWRQTTRNFQGGYPFFIRGGSHAMLANYISNNRIYYFAHTEDRCGDESIPMSSVDTYSK